MVEANYVPIFSSFRPHLASATDETKLLLSPSAKQPRSQGSHVLGLYLSTRYDWPVKKGIACLPNHEVEKKFEFEFVGSPKQGPRRCLFPLRKRSLPPFVTKP